MAPRKTGGAAASNKKADPAPEKPEGGAITDQLTKNVPAVQLGREGSVVEIAPGVKLKMTKQVTRRVFPQEVGKPLPVKITGEIYKGEKINQGKSKDMDAADLAPVEHLVTKELGLIIVGAVLKGELERSYPNNGYINKCFVISTGEKADGKRFRPVTLFEVDPV